MEDSYTSETRRYAIYQSKQEFVNITSDNKNVLYPTTVEKICNIYIYIYIYDFIKNT